MSEWRQIETAPRDGTIVEVMDPECGTFTMRWNPAGHNPICQHEYGNGLWECPGNNFTWSEDKGFGPRYWRPLTAGGCCQ